MYLFCFKNFGRFSEQLIEYNRFSAFLYKGSHFAKLILDIFGKMYFMYNSKTSNLNRGCLRQGSAPGQVGEEAVQRKRSFRKVAPSISLQVSCGIGYLKKVEILKKT